MWKTNCLGVGCGNLILVPNAGAPEVQCENCGSDLAVATEPFTEQDWLTFDDPYPMLQFARQHASDRKLWLFCYASARRQLDPIVEALDQAERHVAEANDRPARDAFSATLGLKFIRQFLNGGSGEEWVYRGDLNPYELKRAVVPPGAWSQDAINAHLALLRDIVGNPFRKPKLPRAVLKWNDRTLPRLAQAIFDERRFADMPVLADALEEAGCADQNILSHCRGGSTHVRGCWVVDLLLQKK
jgi:hypothetical protein